MMCYKDFTMKLHIWHILIIVSWLIATSVFADVTGGYAAPFLELPPMASSVAFAGACITYDPEPAALLYNPANIDGCCNHSVQASIEKLPLSNTRYALAGIFKHNRFRFGAGFLQHSIGDIYGRDAVGNPTNKMTYGYSAIAFGVSYGIADHRILRICQTPLWTFSTGITAKILMQQDDGNSAGSGFTIDAGISGRYGYIRYGLLLRNAYGEMKWNNNQTSQLQRAIIGGIGFEYCESHWAEISAEAKVMGRVRWRMGGQFLVNNWAGFRAGIDFSTGTPTAINETRIAAGGVIYYRTFIPLEISYSTQYIHAIHGWAFSTAISWNTF